MNTNKQVRLIKIAFWIGAITDALAAKIMIFPKLQVYLFGSENFSISPDYRYALLLGASLMLGWTVLLIWGSQKPFERRGLLIITVFPVITGIVFAQIYAVLSGYIILSKIIPIWIHLSLLSAFYLYLYFSSNQSDQ